MNAQHEVTTAFVRKHYSQGPTAYFEDGRVAKVPSALDVTYAGEQFDRWLAGVKTEARSEGHSAGYQTARADLTSGIVNAQQEFRDGAALGARIMAERLIAVDLMGVNLTAAQIRSMAEEVRSEYGGTYVDDSKAREAARVR